MKIDAEEIKNALLSVLKQKREFPIGEINDYLIEKNLIDEKMDFRDIFDIAEPVMRDLGLEWYGVYGHHGIIVRDPKGVVLDGLKNRIEVDGWAHIPDGVYGSIDSCVRTVFGMGLEEVLSRYEVEINKGFNALKSKYRKENKEKIQIPKYQDKWEIMAYLLHYFYVNYPKLCYILFEQLEKPEKRVELLPEKDFLNIFDFGAGPALRSICDFLEDAKTIGSYIDTELGIYFVEENDKFAEVCEIMLDDFDFVTKVQRVGDEILNDPYLSFDLIVLSNVVSELDMSPGEKVRYLGKFTSKLKENGHIIILEPAYDSQRDDLGCMCNELRDEGSCEIVYYSDKIVRKRLKTPEMTTKAIKAYFENPKPENTIKYLYAILKRT
ncbi:MAG: hypothetical protein SYNGOMJ08_00603 [Candidatus Syntrophoarchaeum sp. GoM_oil]|nr:MAG: hypothetical protein SYNGOMJ08_00603 [Candidatus Syntrophoarchaeum sp. GoM_oil]